MTAETDLLPMPWIERYAVVGDIAYPVSSDPDGDYVAHDDHAAAMQAYARACVSSATEALRAEVESLKSDLSDYMQAANYQATRAERLAEALRDARHAGSLLANIAYNLAQDESLSEPVRWSLDDARKRWDQAATTANAALEQETTNGQ